MGGKSEWNTLEKDSKLSNSERKDSSQFWKYYIGGVDRLAYEAAFLYHHRFCNTTQWEQVEIQVMDFDCSSNDDFIGRVIIPTIKVTKKTVKLCRNKNKFSRNSLLKSVFLTYSMFYDDFTVPRQMEKSLSSYTNGTWHRRLKGSWKLIIHEAHNVPSMDPKLNPFGRTKNDPYCVIVAMSSKIQKGRSFCQLTSTKQNVSNPKWEETFDLPVASVDTALTDALLYAGGSNLVNGEPEQENDGYGIQRVRYLDAMFGGTEVTNVGSESVDISNDNFSIYHYGCISPNDKSMRYHEWKKHLSACTLQCL